MYHPTDVTEALEYIELYNDRAVFEDLSGWSFTKGIQYEFEDETLLPAKSYLVIARDPEAIKTTYGITDALGPFTGRLSNDGERIELNHPAGAMVLSLAYNDVYPWPVAPDGTGHSLTRVKLGGDPTEASTWAPSTYLYGTPGEPDRFFSEPENPTMKVLIGVGHEGTYFEGRQEPSPGASGQAGTAWTAVNFTDNPGDTIWKSGPSGYGYSNNNAELQSIRTVLDDMPGNYLSVYARLRFELTTEEISQFSSLQAEVNYDDAFVLYLNGQRVGDSGNISGQPPTYQTTSNTGTDYGPVTIDLSGFIYRLIAGTNVLAIQGHNHSLSGSSDFVLSPTLRAVIAAPVSPASTPEARLTINEVIPGANGWVELYNPGPAPLDLANLYLSNNRQHLLMRPLSSGLLRPGDLHITNFTSPTTGGQVYVTAADPGEASRVLDAIRYPALPTGRSYGRTPNGADRMTTLDEPTRFSANAGPLGHDIVINEIMYHHATRDNRYEYVELTNVGSQAVSLRDWAFTDGIDYSFAPGTTLRPGEYLVVAKDPNLLQDTYDHLVWGDNLVGPYQGNLDDHSERIRLSRPAAGVPDVQWMVDEVTYYDGGRWPVWADGDGSSLELRQPDSDNDTPDAWAASDESGKSTWEPFSFTVEATDRNYTHDTVTLVDLMLVNHGEVLLDDLEVDIQDDTGGSGRRQVIQANKLDNGGFENGTSGWRKLGNHIQSHATDVDAYSGDRCLHLIATGHGDPGANRINQSIDAIGADDVTFSGWARWLRGCPYLLMRTTREESPVQPPRPSHTFALTRPNNLGSPGLPNTALVAQRGPDIVDVKHEPVLPRDNEPISVQAHVTGSTAVWLSYRSEGDGGFTRVPMADTGNSGDTISGDRVFTAVIPGAARQTMRAFFIEAQQGQTTTRFPTLLPPSANVPIRTCLIRVGDTQLSTRFATYRIWLSDAVIAAFRARPSLSNELLDCTFVYNDTEVFYNARLRMRGSPFLRRGYGRDPRGRYAYRVDFNPDQRFRDREEINLDNTEGSNRGPLQERASYWFYDKMGLPFSRQEYVRPIINGSANGIYEDVQKIDGDYIRRWFTQDREGYIHKIDDYFEYAVNGDGFRNLDEGLIHDSRHPLLPETYRWGFEKRSHQENDTWDHLLEFAAAMNTSSNNPGYEATIDSLIHPEHFMAVLALRHAVGDWDSYGFDRGKNNYFYYALPEGKWYLLPWDIDFTLGSGRGPTHDLFALSRSKFPEVDQLFRHPKYSTIYLRAFANLIGGPWQTSYGTDNPPTAFDRFLDDAADALQAEGLGGGRRNSIKDYVRERRAYIMQEVRDLQP